MLNEYYEPRGWNKKIGLPLRSTLQKRGLNDVAEALEKIGKLID